MFRFALASALATAEAGTLAVTWEDCGAKHGVVKDLQPTTIHTGATETLTGTGTSDEDVTSAHFTATLSALGAKLADCDGDATTDIVCNLPMGVGHITVKALTFPIPKGTVTIPVEVQTSSIIPPSLANVDVHIAAVDQNGESAICMDVHTAAQKLSSAPTWEEYKQQYGKVYNGQEEDARRAQFEINSQLIEEHNAKEGETFEMGYNQFTDLNQEEFRVAAGLGYKPPAEMYGSLPYLGEHVYEEGEELAASIDWTTQGAVTAVKNQGQCGSCWAFSTTGGMEGAWQIASGRLQSLSEQQLVDCSHNGGNAGCNGGDMGAAFTWAKSHDIATESSYSYKGSGGRCKTSGFKTAIPAGGITGYKSVGKSSKSLKSALNRNPVSVAIEADQSAFQNYRSGTLSASSCGTNLDHGVLAVGYASGYFKVKNSWGRSWGKSGYVQISDSGNACGIHSDATYPTVSASVAV